MSEQLYPGVFLRVKALVIDSIMLVLMMGAVTFLFSKLESVPETFRIVAFVVIFVLYDPLLTSMAGGTVGHKANGIRVKRASNHNKNILLPMAILRFLIKAFLGIISLVTLSFNDERRGIHDLASGSVVLYDQQPAA